MSTTSVEVSTGPEFDPANPPTRIYLGNTMYRRAAPFFVRPPLANTVKLVLNWTGPAGLQAHNVTYDLLAGTIDLTVPVNLTACADSLMTAWASAAAMGNIAAAMGNISNAWSLTSVTAHDNGSSSGAVGASSHAAIPGLGSNPPLPPQSAVCISWTILASYRGGKPRWYLPGLVNTGTTTTGGAAIIPSVAASIESTAFAFLNSFNAAHPIAGATQQLGTISYLSHGSVRPTPIFRPFVNAVVHERLDSQRRRSGKESAYGHVP